MSFIKRGVAVVLVSALAALMCLVLAGCGGSTAATWNKGSLSEDEVTETITTMRTYYGLSSSDSGWASFVKSRSYKSTDDVSASEDSTEGTVEELRAYMIEQLIRNKIVEDELKSRNITISDQEVDEYVEQQRATVEAQYMPGVFESVLKKQGYTDLKAYKEEVREQLKLLKLQDQVSNFTKDDGTELTGTEGWNAWLDKMYADANVKINNAPSSLPYAIAG